MSHSKTTQWGSRIGFILAGAGSAIGLGAIWKFPFWAGTYGGSAFIIPYIFFTFTIGVALVMAELAIGRAGRGSAVSAMKRLGGPAFAVMGGIGVLTSYIILSYYSVVGGWCVKYLFDALGGNLVTSDPKLLADNFGALVADPAANISWHLIFLTLSCGVVAMGVVAGIERISKYLLPMLFVLMLLITGRSLTLDGAMQGIDFLFNFSFNKLTLESVMNAMGLTFFSLSLGCTILVTYGLYLKDSTDIPSSAGWISYLAIQTGILAGLMIMPAVFAMGQDPKAGPGLVFITIPLVFSQIPFGAAFAALFYVCLLVAALTSAISLVEVVVAYLCYEWHLSRKRASLLIYITIFLLGSASALSFGPWSGWTVGGKILFDLLDYVCTNIMMPAGGLAIAILAGWIARDKFRAQISQVRKYPEGVLRFLTFAVRYLAPVMVLLVLISGL